MVREPFTVIVPSLSMELVTVTVSAGPMSSVPSEVPVLMVRAPATSRDSAVPELSFSVTPPPSLITRDPIECDSPSSMMGFPPVVAASGISTFSGLDGTEPVDQLPPSSHSWLPLPLVHSVTGQVIEPGLVTPPVEGSSSAS